MPSAFPYHAMHAIDVLRHFGARRGEVISSGKIKPGDIFWVRAGSIIPTDGRIISCKDFATDVYKNNLPGESCMVSAGDRVSKGIAEIIAVAPFALGIRQDSSAAFCHPFQGEKRIQEIRNIVQQITGKAFQKHFIHGLVEKDAVSPDRHDVLVDEIPYHEENKFAASLWRARKSYKVRAWGDARTLLERANTNDRQSRLWHNAVSDVTNRGLTAMLFAERDLAEARDFQKAAQTDLVPLVLIGLS